MHESVAVGVASLEQSPQRRLGGVHNGDVSPHVTLLLPIVAQMGIERAVAAEHGIIARSCGPVGSAAQAAFEHAIVVSLLAIGCPISHPVQVVSRPVEVQPPVEVEAPRRRRWRVRSRGPEKAGAISPSPSSPFEIVVVIMGRCLLRHPLLLALDEASQEVAIAPAAWPAQHTSKATSKATATDAAGGAAGGASALRGASQHLRKRGARIDCADSAANPGAGAAVAEQRARSTLRGWCLPSPAADGRCHVCTLPQGAASLQEASH
mmetsp:Transcript_155015/g.496874  ORF Transcript_155015/g.496874 Transcript_155015/m.496874 type:complete len:265 (+) Transcript_155015:2084-2878(+)